MPAAEALAACGRSRSVNNGAERKGFGESGGGAGGYGVALFDAGSRSDVGDPAVRCAAAPGCDRHPRRMPAGPPRRFLRSSGPDSFRVAFESQLQSPLLDLVALAFPGYAGHAGFREGFVTILSSAAIKPMGGAGRMVPPGRALALIAALPGGTGSHARGGP